mgnify:CR=1 FL=1
MIKAGIIGSTGYAGGELVRILTGHKDVEIKWFGSRSYIDKKYADVYRNMFQIVDAVCLDDNMEQLADQVDVIFTATPQGLCASLVFLADGRLIAMSGRQRENAQGYGRFRRLWLCSKETAKCRRGGGGRVPTDS